MTIRRASLILPCRRLEDFPTHLSGQAAAELLASWTALWHPALINATEALPGWHPAEEPPDPATLEGELVVIPSASRQRLASDWCDRVRATAPGNPPPVEACASRAQTIEAALTAAQIAPNRVAPDLVADFLALGYAHLQVELLTQAMRYTSVLDVEQFTNAVVGAAKAAIAGDNPTAQEELARAFDLVADARNHVYAVDFYVVDVTLLASTTLGESLRAKLAVGSPTSILLNGELIEHLMRQHPDSAEATRAAMVAGTACVIGGRYHAGCSARSPEALLEDVKRFQRAVRENFGREAEIYGQFDSAFTPMLPEILSGLGFDGALHVAFDGGRLPRAEQCKTRWGKSDGAWIEALSTTPMDTARPETWLTFAERVGDTIAHDHVATVLLAGWPGQECEYYDDLRRAARFNPVLGKLVTLDEYFRVSRETDDWTTFVPTEYRSNAADRYEARSISKCVRTQREDVLRVYERLAEGLRSIATSAGGVVDRKPAACPVSINPWNFPCSRYAGVNVLDFLSSPPAAGSAAPSLLPDVPGCGFALIESVAANSPVPLADERILRNEHLEVTISATTGGIQSLRTHADRSTRVSQRLVYEDRAADHVLNAGAFGDSPRLDGQMLADEVAVTRNDGLIGEITSRGRLLDAANTPLARFTQTVRLARGLPAAIIDVQLQPERVLSGEIWRTYFASRLAWLDEAATLRRGAQWLSRPVTGERIGSPEWVEITTDAGNIVCFPMGLPFHRQAAATWLDTLLPTDGDQPLRYQFALGLDSQYPTQTSLALLSAGAPAFAEFSSQPAQPRGWLLHLGARNLVITHLEALSSERDGIRCRVLETEGRSVETMLTAYRAFRSARATNFRGETDEVLSVVDGRVRFGIDAYRWIQIEAEW